MFRKGDRMLAIINNSMMFVFSYFNLNCQIQEHYKFAFSRCDDVFKHLGPIINDLKKNYCRLADCFSLCGVQRLD